MLTMVHAFLLLLDSVVLDIRTASNQEQEHVHDTHVFMNKFWHIIPNVQGITLKVLTETNGIKSLIK